MSPANRITPAAGDHPVDELAAYALDAVDGDERRAIEAHLTVCASCRRDLAAHQEVLSRMIGDESPPTAVWDKIVLQTRALDDAEIPAPGPRPLPGDVVPLDGVRSPRHLRAPEHARTRRRLAGALAVAAAVAVAVGVAPRLLDGSGDDGPPTTELVAPDLPVGDVVAADGTTVAHVRADERGSYVEMAAMAPLPDRRTYQLWSLDGADPVSLGLLGPGTDPVVRVSLPDGTTSVAISDEPAGGSPAPSGLVAGTGELAVPA